jgi:ABC-type oligopeptide transport system ATPase subunit
MSLFSSRGGVVVPAQRYDTVSHHNVELDPKRHQLHLQDVVKVYKGSDGPKTVLDNVDLQVSEGEFVALVGPSGCGKSTLLRLILGQEEPTSGALYLGESLSGTLILREVLSTSSTRFFLI